MIIQDIINKKRRKEPLTDEEIVFFVQGVAKDLFRDYEVSALLMAIAINGMNKKEISTLTIEMSKTGDMVDLSEIDGVKADKHSTGGISDTTTLVIVPILACLNVKMAKMSGRSLGFTGGTADKLEAIDGFVTELPIKKFIQNVKTIGASMITQTGEIAVADKKLYALRDVTATVESIPLIASSIMSKKLASGADIILLDVKYGSGAFMKTKRSAIKLAKTMVEIGKSAGKKMCAIITSMEQQLGNGIGCTMEVKDAIEVLNGTENALWVVSKKICVEILKLAFSYPTSVAKKMIDEVIKDKTALHKFAQIVENQNGNKEQIYNPEKLKESKYRFDVVSKKLGKVTQINGEQLGNIVKQMGGGRVHKNDTILHEVGIDMYVNIGSRVNKNTILMTIHYNDGDIGSITSDALNAIKIENVHCVRVPKLIVKTIK